MKTLKLCSTLTCYEFDELSEKAKEKLRDKFRKWAVESIRFALAEASAKFPNGTSKIFYRETIDKNELELWIKKYSNEMFEENFFTKEGEVIGNKKEITDARYDAAKLREILEDTEIVE